GARHIDVLGNLEVERGAPALLEPERVALDPRAERLARVLAVGPAGHGGVASRVDDPLVLGRVVGVHVPTVHNAQLLLHLGRVAPLLDPYQVAGPGGETDIRAVKLLGAAALAVEDPGALGAGLVDDVEAVVPLEQRRNLLHGLHSPS